MANMRDINITRSREADALADDLQKKLGLTTDEKFVAVALMCGPPTSNFNRDFVRAAQFMAITVELFNVDTDMKTQRGLYRLYERWHHRNELQRMLDEKKATPDP